MKELIRAAILGVADRLPWGARDSLMRHLIDRRGTAEVLRYLAREANLLGFLVDGQNGLVEGNSQDAAVLLAYARKGSWAASTLQRFEKFFHAGCGGTYLDIGANIGLTTIPLAKNPAVECFAFEPEPMNFRFLQRNVLTNCPHGNVRLFNRAVFDKPSHLTFEISPDNMGDNRVRLGEGIGALGEKSWQVIQVEAARLDDMINSPRKPMAAKIDTQGAEPYVITGGLGTLSRVELLSIEFWPWGMRRMGGDPATVTKFLRATFTEGLVSKGDTEPTGGWEPIGAIADRLDEIDRQNARAERAYWDVLARKA